MHVGAHCSLTAAHNFCYVAVGQVFPDTQQDDGTLLWRQFVNGFQNLTVGFVGHGAVGRRAVAAGDLGGVAIERWPWGHPRPKMCPALVEGDGV
jgi:hypothetical protein